MERVVVLLAMALVTSACWSGPALSLMTQSELDASDIGQLSHWLPGLEKLVNYGGVVYGVHVDAPTFFRGLETMYIFFKGDHEEFNEMLKEYAKLGDSLNPYVETKEVHLILTLHAGHGNVGSDAGGTIAKGKSIPFDWKITLTREGTLVPDREKRRYSVRMDLWVGGEVELGKVKVPLSIEVKSGGEIEKFVAEHEAKRKSGKEPEGRGK